LIKPLRVMTIGLLLSGAALAEPDTAAEHRQRAAVDNGETVFV